MNNKINSLFTKNTKGMIILNFWEYIKAYILRDAFTGRMRIVKQLMLLIIYQYTQCLTEFQICQWIFLDVVVKKWTEWNFQMFSGDSYMLVSCKTHLHLNSFGHICILIIEEVVHLWFKDWSFKYLKHKIQYPEYPCIFKWFLFPSTPVGTSLLYLLSSAQGCPPWVHSFLVVIHAFRNG